MNEIFIQVVGDALAITFSGCLAVFVGWLIVSFVKHPAAHGAVEDKDTH